MILGYICFLPGSLNSGLLADLLEMDLGFAPERIRTNQFGGHGGVAFDPRSLDKLRGLSEVSSLEVVAGEESMSLSGLGGWPGQVIVMNTVGWPSEAVIEAASALPGFVAAMVGDADDVFWQSADQINTYQVFGRPWEHLPTVRDEVFDRPKIDISAHPGRQTAAPGMWLWASAKLWFGPGSFALLDRERLLSLPVGVVAQRSDGVVVVELFDLDAPIDVIRDAQRTLRSWLRYDDLGARAADLVTALADPRVEFECGTFPHGGARRVTEWLSEGRLAPRSAATTRHTIELSSDGRPLWEETVDTE